ncbi:MAG: S8 family serine peptidase [Thermoplasmatota archaeon]
MKVINYVPNYAYEVRMTPKQAQEIRDMFFVDWVGIYHPGYKFNDDIEPGLVNINMAPGSDQETLNQINSISRVKTVIGKRGEKCDVRTNVSSLHKIKSIAKLNDVYFISEHNKMVADSEIDSQLVGGGCWFMDDDDNPNTPYRKYGNYGLYINQLGYTGEGITVAVADSGIGDGTAGSAGHPDFENRVIGGVKWHNDDHWIDTEGSWIDTDGHGTHVAGIVAGNAKEGTEISYKGLNGNYSASMGLAYDSELFAIKCSAVSNDNIDYYEVVEKAKTVPDPNNKAYIHTNSYSEKNNLDYYHSIDKDFDEAVRDANSNEYGNQPMIITASAGNTGAKEEYWTGDDWIWTDTKYETIGTPGKGKNIITVGASESYNPDAHHYGALGFENSVTGAGIEFVKRNGNEVGPSNPEKILLDSSRGWALGNRVKPDVVAPGYCILSTQSPVDSQLNLPYSESNEKYAWMSGTSMSTPLVAGASAVTVEWYQDNYGSKPSPAMVKALLINTANDLVADHDGDDIVDHIPNKHEGWGIVDISKLEYPKNDPVPFTVEDQKRLLTTGKVEEYKVNYDRNNEPLKISLVWTDKEAQPGDNPTLKNDLNLKVVSPSGDIYKGNAFSSGWTQKNTDTMSDFDYDSDGYDDMNNVENVYIKSSDLESGTYKVLVEGENIPCDGTNYGYGYDNQDFAIVAYNARTVLDVEITNPPVDGWKTFLSEVTVEWEGGLMENDLNSKEVKIDDSSWVSAYNYESHKFFNLPDGWYTVYVKETDRYGNSVTKSRSFQVDSDGGPM